MKMKFVFTEFSFKWNHSILYESRDDQITFDTLVDVLNFLKFFLMKDLIFWLGSDAWKMDDQIQYPLWSISIILRKLETVSENGDPENNFQLKKISFEKELFYYDIFDKLQ